MTIEDAIKVLSDIREKHKLMREISVTDAARLIHMDSIEMYALAIEALKKQVPKKIVRKRKEDQYTGKCPNCGTDLMYKERKNQQWK